MKKGFTLVELSIVLVIIGLLIGGILAAQSMVNTAKIQGVLRQITQYDAAVGNFITKYRQLPGDTNLLPSPGDNDYKIESMNVAPPGQPPNYDERLYFWYHLSQGVGIQDSKGNPYAAIGVGVQPTANNCPQFDLKQDSLTAGFPCLIPYGNYNIWYYTSYTGLNNQSIYDPVIPIDALVIDKKMDDSIPTSGKVQGGSWGTTGGSGAAYCYSAGFGAPYNIKNTASLCAIKITMGLTNGLNLDENTPW